MDIPELKLLAGRIRGLLQQSSCLVGHSQALDLIAALPGLRNWPEVMAFPERVTVCELDTTSVSRLAYRINKKFSLEVEPKELFASLAQDGVMASRGLLQVWPGGPLPGVYVTTFQIKRSMPCSRAMRTLPMAAWSTPNKQPTDGNAA